MFVLIVFQMELHIILYMYNIHIYFFIFITRGIFRNQPGGGVGGKTTVGQVKKEFTILQNCLKF